jgi:hypothetical protein
MARRLITAAKKLTRIGPWRKEGACSLCSWKSTLVEFPTDSVAQKKIKRDRVKEEFSKHSCTEHPRLSHRRPA